MALSGVAGDEAYAGPAGPEAAAAPVRILQRPSGARGGPGAAPGPRPVRSLQQRQQEYEAARLRILGEARPSDQQQSQQTQNVQIKTDPIRLQNANNKPKDKPIDGPAHYFVPNNIMTVQPRIMNQRDYVSANSVSLLRNPRGPDQTKGFHLRR